MTRFLSQFRIQHFQHIVACFLLVTFVPVAVLCEGIHLLTGVGTCCQSLAVSQSVADADSLSGCHSSSHQHSQQQKQHSHQQHSGDGCVVCEFCTMFYGAEIAVVYFGQVLFISEVELIDPISFDGGVVSLFHARAPPVT
jgi:hypothetical protein